MLERTIQSRPRLAPARHQDDDTRRFSTGPGSPGGGRLAVELVAARAVRLQAGFVLRRLVADRDRSVAHLEELGRVDAIKALTGRSALDRAVADAQRVVRDMDQLIADLLCQQRASGDTVVLPRSLTLTAAP